MKIRTLALLLATLSASPLFAYSSLEELLKETNRQQTEALRAYVAANPEADDFAEARERLIYGLLNQDDFAEALAMLQQMYAALPEDKSTVEIESAFGEIVVPIIQVLRMEGRKDEALAFIAKVREEFKSHEMVEMVNGALDEFTGMFDAPVAGDALEIAFTAIDGREVDLAAMTGKVVLVDFWATWCAPCIRAMPGVKALYEEFHARGFEIIGISLDEEREALDEYLAKESLPWPQYFDGKGWEGELATKYRIESIPTTFLIGPDGKIVAVDAPESKLRELIGSLLPAP